jgi:hypothetical protein
VALITLVPQGVTVAATLRTARGLKCHAIGHGRLPATVLSRLSGTLGGNLSGHIALRLPYPPGLGTGMSTAGLLAVARLASGPHRPEALARACLAAEGASDPLMFPDPATLLWAPRRGKVLAALPPQPQADLLAGFWGPPRPTRPTDQDYDDISDLVALWQRGGPLAERAELAGESARRCLARRGPVGDPTAQLARDLGALGWAMSHSGAARALIFAPGQVPALGLALLREAGLRGAHLLTTRNG